MSKDNGNIHSVNYVTQEHIKKFMTDKLDEQVKLLETPDATIRDLNQYVLFGFSVSELLRVKQFISSFYFCSDFMKAEQEYEDKTDPTMPMGENGNSLID